MKKLLCLLFLTSFLHAQEKPKERTWTLKLNVSQLIDVVTFPNVSLGVEKKINRYLSVNAEFGYQFYDGTRVPDTIFFNQKGFKTNLEFRFYPVKLFRPNWQGIGWFVGIQGFYRWNQYNASTEYVPIDPNPDINNDPNEVSLRYFDHFGVRKSAAGFNVVLGYQHTFNRFLIEPFIGIGYMNRKITNYHRQYDSEKQEESNGPHDFFSTDLEEDSGNNGNFLLGFRIGLKL